MGGMRKIFDFSTTNLHSNHMQVDSTGKRYNEIL